MVSPKTQKPEVWLLVLSTLSQHAPTATACVSNMQSRYAGLTTVTAVSTVTTVTTVTTGTKRCGSHSPGSSIKDVACELEGNAILALTLPRKA